MLWADISESEAHVVSAFPKFLQDSRDLSDVDTWLCGPVCKEEMPAARPSEPLQVGHDAKPIWKIAHLGLRLFVKFMKFMILYV